MSELTDKSKSSHRQSPDRRSGTDRRSGPRTVAGQSEGSLADQGQITVAQSLHQAREDAGLSIAEVAAATHISRKQIAVLESGEFSQLHSLVFLKGYLQIYSEYLKLDSEELLARYEAEFRVNEPESPEVNNTKGVPGPASQRWIALSSWISGLPMWRLGAMAVTPLMLVMLLAWSYYSIDNPLDMPAAEVASAAVPDALGPLANIAVSTDIPDGPMAPSSLDLLVDEPEFIAGNTVAIQPAGIIDGPAADLAVDENRVEDNVSNNNDGSVMASIGNVRQPEALRAPENTRQPELAVMSNRVPVANVRSLRPSAAAMVAQHIPSDRLVIAVIEDSWVDIRDSEGNRLYRDLARAGNKIEVSGMLPFSLHVGNAPGLYLELNGAPFDIGDYRADNSARLTIAMQ